MNTATQELLTTDVGLLSLFALIGIVAIGGYMWLFVRRKIREDAARASQNPPR